jgi:hypothetical protein
MLFTKIFHLHQSAPAARQRLRDFRTWKPSDNDLDRLIGDIEEVPCNEPTRIVFRSARGDVALAGLIELFEIRPNLTEAVLTLDYEPLSPLQKAVDAIDRFLNRQLARIESCMERAGSSGAPSAMSRRFV